MVSLFIERPRVVAVSQGPGAFASGSGYDSGNRYGYFVARMCRHHGLGNPPGGEASTKGETHQRPEGVGGHEPYEIQARHRRLKMAGEHWRGIQQLQIAAYLGAQE